MRPPVSHYCVGKIESIDFIEDQGHMVGFCLGNIIKYATRCMYKGEPLGDLDKIASYAIMLKDYIEEKNNDY